jgi:hypothetical protein
MLNFKHAAHKIRFLDRRLHRSLVGRHRSSHGFIPYPTRRCQTGETPWRRNRRGCQAKVHSSGRRAG